MNVMDDYKTYQYMKIRILKSRVYKYLFFAGTLISLIVLAILFVRIFLQGVPYLDWKFLNILPARRPEEAGIYTAIHGTLWMMAVVAPVTLVLGVGTAIYLEEYAQKNRFTTFIQVNISNLAGVPSVVYGLLGLTIFVRAFHLGTSVLAAGLTMSLLILPVVIVAAQEAIRAVPSALREASYAMGANDITSCITSCPSGNLDGDDFSPFSGNRRNGSARCIRSSIISSLLTNFHIGRIHCFADANL